MEPRILEKSEIRIFLAHANEDKPMVRELYRKLKQEGYRPWLDEEDLLPGQLWRKEIAKAIKSSNFFVACLSEQSIAKTGYVQKEFRLALNHFAELPPGDIYLIPLKFDDCQIPDLRQEEYGITLQDVQWLNYYKPDGFKRLIQAIEHQRGKMKRTVAPEETIHQETTQSSESFEQIVPGINGVREGAISPVTERVTEPEAETHKNLFKPLKVLLRQHTNVIVVIILLLVTGGICLGYYLIVILQPPFQSVSKAYLDFSLELARWGIRGYRPASVDLSDKPPENRWIEPPSIGLQRLYGILTLAGTTRIGVILDVLDSTESQLVFAFDGDTDFSDNPSYRTVKGSLPDPIEFQIEYPDRIRQKYAIRVYYPVDFARKVGAYRLHYYRASVRRGTVSLGGVDYPLAIGDGNADGLYSDLETTEVWLDVNQDGKITDGEQLAAASSFAVAGTYYIISDITPAGSRVTITQARFGEVVGRVVNAQSNAPVSGAKITLSPNQVSTVTDSKGMYRIKAPEGKYWQLSALAERYVPHYKQLNQRVAAEQSLSFDISLSPDTTATARSGLIRMNPGDSYHFLLGKWHQHTGGDFYFGFSDGEAKFWANNMHQYGLVDLGDVGNVQLSEIEPPASGYNRFGVPAIVGHTYVSPAKSGEEGHYIIFRVTSLRMSEYVEIEFYYR